MYQRDYLMRQIEQAARVLAAIMRKALGGEPDQALGMFDQAYQPLLGVSQRVVSTLTDEQLISLLTSGSMPDLRRVASVLEAGGLPREEVKSSLAELLRRQVPEEDPDDWPEEDPPPWPDEGPGPHPS